MIPHAINHLLAAEPWARQQLLAHAGKVAVIDLGALLLRLRVSADGMVETAATELASDVTIRIKLSDLPLIAANPGRAFSYVKIDGDADFANAISQLSQTLRWDAEYDLSRWLGDIAAHRLVAAAKTTVTSLQATHRSLAENVAEYLLEEQPLLVRPSALTGLGDDLNKLRDDVERFAKRIEKLEGKR